MKKKILTDREQEVFELLIKNKSTFEIAKKLNMEISLNEFILKVKNKEISI